MTKEKKLKLTKAQKKIVDKIRKGATIMQNANSDPSKFVFTDGSSVHGGVIENLIKKNVLLPAGDGLLPGTTQTYRLAEVA